MPRVWAGKSMTIASLWLALAGCQHTAVAPQPFCSAFHGPYESGPGPDSAAFFVPPSLSLEGASRKITLAEAVALALKQGRIEGTSILTLNHTTAAARASAKEACVSQRTWFHFLRADNQAERRCCNARFQSAQAIAERARKVQDLLLQVETAYWTLHCCQAIYQVQLATLKQLHEEIFKARTLYNEGSLTQQDLDRMEELFHQARAVCLQAASTNSIHPGVLEAERQLRLVMGLPPEDGQRLVPCDTPIVTAPSIQWGQDLASAFAHNPELNKLRLELKAARWLVEHASEQEQAQASRQLEEKRLALRDGQELLVFSLSRRFREVHHAHKLIGIQQARRIPASARVKALTRKREANLDHDPRELLEAKRHLASIIVAEHQAICTYNVALATYERVKGTLSTFRVQHIAP